MQRAGGNVKGRDDGGDKRHNMAPLVRLRRLKNEGPYGGPALHGGRRTCGHCQMYAADSDWVGPDIWHSLPYIKYLVIADALA